MVSKPYFDTHEWADRRRRYESAESIGGDQNLFTRVGKHNGIFLFFQIREEIPGRAVPRVL